jgi:hypothetical protein
MSKPKLLVVEDDAGLCAQYRWAFPNFRVVIANDRRQAEAMAKREQPSVIPARPRPAAGCRRCFGGVRHAGRIALTLAQPARRGGERAGPAREHAARHRPRRL